jgi:vesicle-associated membrane protein-associated protein A
MLQAMKEEPPLNIKCKDKFLIQSTLITPEKSGLDLVRLPLLVVATCVLG